MHDVDHDEALAPFFDEGWIAEILYEVKSGKEATVFCCRGGSRSPVPLLAAKVFRPIESRRFRNDADYLAGRVHMAREGRARRAVRNKSAFGRQVQYGTWISEEWEVLNVLHEAGASVPRPLALDERAILMPFIGDEDGCAPMLHERSPSSELARRWFDDVMRTVELMLDHDCVHGDLSPYNIMVDGDRIVVIDFPQAIDPRLNRNGRALLERDIDNMCRWVKRYGTTRSSMAITNRLWSRFMLGELG